MSQGIALCCDHRLDERLGTVGYGVIGNTTVSGSVILGSSPGTPAVLPIWETVLLDGWKNVECQSDPCLWTKPHGPVV
jgi:hypothetical protein